MELYPEDLTALRALLGYVEDVANQEGVEDVEIRVKLNGSDSWAVLSYGESGDPCVVRFEDDKRWEFPKQTTLPGINPNPSIWTTSSTVTKRGPDEKLA